MGKRGILEDLLNTISSDLAAEKVQFALIGGLAVGSHTIPRMTKDVDVCIAVTGDKEAEDLIRRLVKKGYGIVAILEHVSGRLATARLTVPASRSCSADVDLMFCSCGIEEVIVAGSVKLSSLGKKIRIASVGHLIAMKVLSESPTRLTDRVDLQNLLEVASDKDLEDARSALLLIQKRGFNRRKNLLKRFTFFLKQ